MECVFIRDKINDYLCRKFIAEEILHGISTGTSLETRSISPDDRERIKTSTMQTDQGSSAYNAWLTK